MRKFFSALLGLFLLSQPSAGKELVGIVAVVNDSAISVLDLIARTKMVALSSGLDDTPELRAQLAKPVLENLIEEKLQKQEAERRGISVTDQELAAALNIVERQNGIREGQLNSWLADIGLPAIFFEDQIRAQILWAKVVSTSLRPLVDVSQEEVEHELARLEANRGLPEYLVSQIDFYVGPSKPLDDLLEVASKLLAEINAGANFGSIAEQFSDNALGNLGGDMGWVSPTQLLPELSVALSEMRPGQVSAPIVSAVGVHLVRLRDRRRVMEPDIRQVRVDLVQIVLPGITGELMTPEQREFLEEIGDTVRGCEAMEARAKKLDGGSGSIGWVLLKDLPEQFRLTLSQLDIGLPSQPLFSGNGAHVMMVCERENPSEDINYEQLVRDRLERSRLETLARRLLRDLRRSALVDIRV